MKVTVVLCTYNRCESLATALDSVSVSQVPPSIPWEVLVIDNNSRDRTRDVVEDFARRYPGRFRYLFESQQGKSFALNRGIREASGDVLAFMDDDVTVDPSWLRKLTVPLESDHGPAQEVESFRYGHRSSKMATRRGDILAPLVSLVAVKSLGDCANRRLEPTWRSEGSVREIRKLPHRSGATTGQRDSQ